MILIAQICFGITFILSFLSFGSGEKNKCIKWLAIAIILFILGGITFLIENKLPINF